MFCVCTLDRRQGSHRDRSVRDFFRNLSIEGRVFAPRFWLVAGAARDRDFSITDGRQAEITSMDASEKRILAEIGRHATGPAWRWDAARCEVGRLLDSPLQGVDPLLDEAVGYLRLVSQGESGRLLLRKSTRRSRKRSTSGRTTATEKTSR